MSSNQSDDTTSAQHKGFMEAARLFFKMEAAGGIVLVITSLVAIIIANSPLYSFYDNLLNGVDFRIGFASKVSGGIDIMLQKSVLLWINDGLMAIFFFLVGLEIKREMLEGELSSRDRALLPALAALGGMVVPAAIFWFINKDTPETLSGWAIPSATDIAFALGVLSLVGNRVPLALKILLMAIAVIDDLGAIVIIGFFYTTSFHAEMMYFAAAILVCLFVLNRNNICAKAPYVLLGILLWIVILKSGVHATLAGVMTAMFIPLINKKDPEKSTLQDIQHKLHPWVAFAVLPIFGFANAGVPFHGMGLHSLMEPVTLGIALGLLFGKQIGIFLTILLAVKLGISPRPRNTSWFQIYAVSVLCGIGFTMSLFIGGLSYEGIEMQAEVRMGVLMGSIIAATIGYCLLRFGPTQMRSDWNRSDLRTRIDGASSSQAVKINFIRNKEEEQS